jgi:glycosyltransferase involved in cell wall biosynthesis
MKDSVSVVIPTYNERGNIEKLIPEISRSCRGIKAPVQIIVVDDNSPDGTGEIAEKLAKKFNVKVIHRPRKLGLASAVIEGFSAAKSSIVGVMDADLSHPPESLPRLIEPILLGEADIVVGSRYAKGGGVEVWPFHRRLMSRAATLFARPLTSIKDPMSGLFFLRKKVIEGVNVNAAGYKIGVVILVKGRFGKVLEVPYLFRNRFVGKSKISSRETYYYVLNLVNLYAYLVQKLLGKLVGRNEIKPR